MQANRLNKFIRTVSEVISFVVNSAQGEPKKQRLGLFSPFNR